MLKGLSSELAKLMSELTSQEHYYPTNILSENMTIPIHGKLKASVVVKSIIIKTSQQLSEPSLFYFPLNVYTCK